MSRKRKKLGDEIRQAINASPLSRYRIWNATGIDKGAFSRFMAGQVGMTLANLEKIADLLDLHIVTGKRGKK